MAVYTYLLKAPKNKADSTMQGTYKTALAGITSDWGAINAAEQARYAQSLGEYNERKRQTEQYLGRALTFDELQSVAQLYVKGGEYGQGLRGMAEEGERVGAAAYQGAAVAAGMSSSAGALNQKTESARRLGLRYAEIEDMRIDKYARALETLGTVKTQSYLTASGIMAGLQQPTYSSVVSPTAGTYLTQKGGIYQTGISEIGATERANIQAKTTLAQTAYDALAKVHSTQLQTEAAKKIETQKIAAAKEFGYGQNIRLV